jgi:hypothetical protein
MATAGSWPAAGTSPCAKRMEPVDRRDVVLRHAVLSWTRSGWTSPSIRDLPPWAPQALAPGPGAVRIRRAGPFEVKPKPDRPLAQARGFAPICG